MTRPMASEDRPISDCQAWIADNYATAKPVERMVERSGLNARTFSRRLKAATGCAPAEYVQDLRLEEDKQMLATEDRKSVESGKSESVRPDLSVRRINTKK